MVNLHPKNNLPLIYCWIKKLLYLHHVWIWPMYHHCIIYANSVVQLAKVLHIFLLFFCTFSHRQIDKFMDKKARNIFCCFSLKNSVWEFNGVHFKNCEVNWAAGSNIQCSLHPYSEIFFFFKKSHDSFIHYIQKKVNSHQMQALVWKMSADLNASHYYYFNYIALKSVLRKIK